MNTTNRKSDFFIDNFRIKTLSSCIFIIVATPTVLDFIFIGSSIARYSRILIFLGVSVFLMLSHERLLFGVNTTGLITPFLILLLYLVGTYSSVINGGVATPNFLLLLLVVVITTCNSDLQSKLLASLGYGIHLLIFLSFVSILIKLNFRNIYFSSVGYPVYFNWLGIPGRNFGIFAHPNILGGAAVASCLFLLGDSRRNRLKLFIPVPILCIFKCGSRTSMIELIVGIIILLSFNSKKITKQVKSIRVDYPIVVAIFLMGFLGAAISYFVTTIRFLDSQSLTGRVSIWQTSLEITRSNSLLGLGWGWQERAVQSQLLNFWESSAHNQILEFLFSTGVLGLFIYLVLLIKGIIFFTEMSSIQKSLFVTILVSGISESYVDLQYPNIQTYIFFMIITSMGRIRI